MSNATGVTAPPAATPPAITNTAVQLWQQTGAPFRLAVTGTSMLPLLRPGDLVVVAPGAHAYPVGTIVVFRQGEQLVVHRVVRRWGPEHWLTKGDNGPVDEPIVAASIIGVVIAADRNGVRWALDHPWWRLWGWLIARQIVAPAMQRWLVRLMAGDARRIYCL